jgi:hypothetical protein
MREVDMVGVVRIGMLLIAVAWATPVLAQDGGLTPGVGVPIWPFDAYVGLAPGLPAGLPIPPSLARTVTIGDAQCIENEFGTAREFGGATVLVSSSPGGPVIATLPIYAGGLTWCARATVPGAPPGSYWVILVYGITTTTSAPAEYWKPLVVPGNGAACIGVPLPPAFPRNSSGSPLTGSWGVNVEGNTVGIAFAGSAEGCAFQSIQLEAGTLPGASNIATTALNGLSATFLNVPNGSYYVRARGVNASGAGPASEEIPISIPKCVASGFPNLASQVAASLNGNQLTISYVPIGGNLQVPPTFHQVLVVRANGTLIQTMLGAATNPFSVTMPPVGAGTYRLVVRTLSPCGGYDHLGPDQAFGTGLTITVP